MLYSQNNPVSQSANAGQWHTIKDYNSCVIIVTAA